MPLGERRKLILAAVVAAGGLFIAIRAFNRSGASGARSIPRETPASVKEAVTLVEFDTKPTSESMPQILDQAERTAAEQARAILSEADLSSDAAEDLAAALKERLAMTLDGDFQRNQDLLGRRGDQISEQEAAERRERWEQQAERLRHRPISLSRLETRLIYLDGVRIADDALEQGFGRLTMTPKPGRFPVPSDPEEGRLTVAEVRLPMENAGPPSGQATKALVGFQFAWSVDRSMWIPWKIVLYGDPNEAHYAIIF